MPDIAGDASTTSAIAIGEAVADILEVGSDLDWFRIELTAGQAVTVTLDGAGATPVGDTYLRMRDSAGNLLVEDDDGGAGLNSLFTFTPQTSGTYFIEVGSFAGSYAGGYQLSVTPSAAPPLPPLWSLDQIATQLESGYWGGTERHWNVSQGGSITVNLAGLTPEGQYFARAALGMWSDVIGVNFVEVASGGQILFDDNQSGAFASAGSSDGIITSANVNVSTAWIAYDGTNLDSYSFQTYIHEIGHALGLGHAGNYNGNATYPGDALYRNDSWANSVMSYFSQSESTYFRDQGFTTNYILSPQTADILAMAHLYGLSAATRSGDTTYGFNATAGRATFNASLLPAAAYTVIDSGGIDTLDYSGFASNQLINLASETFSNVGGSVGNVAIARGTLIENAIGGGGNDRLFGNGADNILSGGGGNDILDGLTGNDSLFGGEGADTLSGGAGADRLSGGGGRDLFRDLGANLHGDTIADLAWDERIQVTDASIAGYSVSVTGNVLAFGGFALTLSSVPLGRVTASAATGGGVDIFWDGVRNDFNGDGRSDILWRHSGGELGEWLGRADGGFVNNGATITAVDGSWQVIGTGDFNGDHRSDLLWRHASGAIAEWLGQGNGGFVNNGAGAGQLATAWTLAETGDFNGDGRDDLIWRHGDGTVVEWLGQATGGFAENASARTQLDSGWRIVGSGDFNGDGRDDLMWRHTGGELAEWLGQANGTFVNNGAAIVRVELSWAIVGTGDFNGDGRHDILWRHSSGEIGEWSGQANGGFATNAAVAQVVDPHWQIAEIGDFNGDGRDDIVWRHGSGAFVDWLGQANGGFASNGAAVTSIDTSWRIQSPDIFLV